VVDLILCEDVPDMAVEPFVTFDWYVPVTVTWPRGLRLLDTPAYEQITWHNGILELKFHPTDGDLIELVLTFPNEIDVTDVPLMPSPIDLGPLSICRSDEERAAGEQNPLLVSAHRDYLVVRFAEQAVATWIGSDPVLVGRSAGGAVVSLCVRWTEEERNLVLHLSR